MFHLLLHYQLPEAHRQGFFFFREWALFTKQITTSKITACFCSLTTTSTLEHLVEKNMFFERGHQSRVDICSDGHQKVGTVVFSTMVHGSSSFPFWSTEQSTGHNKAKWAAEVSGGADSCASMDGGWDELQQISERNAYQMTMGWVCVKATWHRIIGLRKSEDIYIQRQLSPQLKKRGGQLVSSTSIHYVSIKKSNGNRRTHRLRNCHTVKPCSGSEVHLLLNNKETIWGFFNQITVWQI